MNAAAPAQQPVDTAVIAPLFVQIADDAALLIDALEDLQQSSDRTPRLHGALAVLARIGMCADFGSLACGAEEQVWRHDPLTWLLDPTTAAAVQALRHSTGVQT